MTILTQQLLEENVKKTNHTDEYNLRKQLAYLYRVFDYYGWCDLIVTHLSVRIPGEEALLILPFGLAFKEVTPDNLIKVDFDGNILESKAGFQINKNGTVVHRAIYSNYEDTNCILHTHSHYGVAVSNLRDGLMLLDQISMMFYSKVGYHAFEVLFINDDSQQQLIDDIRGKHCVILKNHGLLTIGNSIAEAFWFHYFLETTCKIQVLTMSTGGAINYPDEEVIKDTAANYDRWKDKLATMTLGGGEVLFEAAKRQIGYIFD